MTLMPELRGIIAEVEERPGYYLVRFNEGNGREHTYPISKTDFAHIRSVIERSVGQEITVRVGEVEGEDGRFKISPRAPFTVIPRFAPPNVRLH